MNPPGWVLPLHLLGAVIWLASSIVLGGAGVYLHLRASRTGNLAPRFARALPHVARGLIAPAAVVLLGSGLWLVLGGSEWEISQPWVVLGLVLFVVAVVGAVHLTQVAVRMRDPHAGSAATRLLRPWLFGQAALIVILIAAFVDMAVKPGA